MTIGNILTLTSDEIAIMSDSIDDMIVNFGKNVRLLYPAKQVICNNCIVDPTRKISTNRYRTGGPIPFGQGHLCPVCGGAGLMTQPEHTEIIRMLFTWNPAKFMLLPGNIEVPYGVVETEGLMTDVPKVLQSRIMIAELPIEPYIRARFELSGEPVDTNSIAQGKTFTCQWTRRG